MLIRKLILENWVEYLNLNRVIRKHLTCLVAFSGLLGARPKNFESEKSFDLKIIDNHDLIMQEKINLIVINFYTDNWILSVLIGFALSSQDHAAYELL